MKTKKTTQKMPSEFQLESESASAEATGVRKHPVDLLSDVTIEQVENGHFDDSQLKPTVDDLTR